jgi:hypothetical protein
MSPQTVGPRRAYNARPSDSGPAPRSAPLTRHEAQHLRRSAATGLQTRAGARQWIRPSQDTLATTSTTGWLPYAEFAEEFWETPVTYTRTAQTEVIPDNEEPY